VMVSVAVDVQRELYFAILMDRKYQGPVMIGCKEGGMDIEEVSEKHPEKIFSDPVDIVKGLQLPQALAFAKKFGFSSKEKEQDAANELVNLYKLFIATDCTQLEVNPLAEVAPNGKILSVDAKLNIDDNAFFRQEKLFSWRDYDEEDPREVEASKAGLNYIGLDGEIGCMVNGAGLAMATMDIIHLYGSNPANFLDIGGGATESQVTQAFKILTKDSRVKGLLVNIFGGIMRCDIVASGIIKAARTVNLSVPLVVRLSGTNVDLGKKLMAESGLPIISADSLDEAAQKMVKAVKAKK